MNNIELDSSIQDTNSREINYINNWPLSISFGLILLFPHLSDYVVFAAELGH